MSLTVKAYAKINLWLDITGRRQDGYHTLNTVMRRIDLYDTVEISTNGSGDIVIFCDRIDIPTDEHNCAYKAAKLFFGAVGKNIGADISITKNIPVQAGLGGSSADAAAVLNALNTVCGEPLSREQLLGLGLRIGADVPFCMSEGTAVCTGIGDIMKKTECTEFAVLVVKPQFSCPTADAYRKYDASPLPAKNGFENYCSRIANDRAYLADNLYNIFESLYSSDEIEGIKTQLINAGALGASMTGSGSAVFGIFDTVEAAQNAAEKIETRTKFAVNAI